MGCGVDEAGDQPGTGDPVDLRPFAGDPGDAPDTLALERSARGDPGGDTALQIAGFQAGGGRSIGHALAYALTVGAVDDDGTLAVEFAGPVADGVRVAPLSTGDLRRCRREHVRPADVQHQRRVGTLQLFDQLRNRDRNGHANTLSFRDEKAELGRLAVLGTRGVCHGPTSAILAVQKRRCKVARW